ncbi:MAG: ketopantoate reductase family protein [Thermoanaerobaculia bacterium]|nr:ketopantoate reductase family protein [Thermoanaerobaculia bacterium]
MRIAVLGAGGVGGYYGGALARAGHAVALLARGAHLDALKTRGLEVRTPDERFTVAVQASDDAKTFGECDVAIVAVKTYSLMEVAPAARLLAASGAAVLPFLNGVEAMDRLVEAGVPESQVLGGLTQVSVLKVGPGVVERKSPFQKVAVGERRGAPSERVRLIVEAFQQAGAEARVSEDILADLWRKFAFITSTAAACGLSRAPLGAVRDALYGRLLLERAVKEVLAVARARGLSLEDDEASKILSFIDSIGPAIKPSFLVDLEKGGPTELDDLSGAVSRLGREAGVETPVHDTATAALSAAAKGR